MKGRHHSSASSFPFPFGSRSEAIVRIVFTRIPMANASKKKLAQTPERAVEAAGHWSSPVTQQLLLYSKKGQR